MPDIKAIIENAFLDNMLTCLLNESEPLSKKVEVSDAAIQNSYKEFMKKIVERYPSINGDGVFEALTEFAAIHDEVYFKLGVIVGAGLERELEDGYSDIKKLRIVK